LVSRCAGSRQYCRDKDVEHSHCAAAGPPDKEQSHFFTKRT
jgi:hypothetical protein